MESTGTVCTFCKNQFSFIGLCQSYHYLCTECQNKYQNCPICQAAYLEHDNFLMDTVLGPQNDAKLLGTTTTTIPEDTTDFSGRVYGNTNLQKVKKKEKSPTDLCKEHFFVAVWDALMQTLFSATNTKSKTKKHPTLMDSVSKILLRTSRKMGKSMHNLMVARNPKIKTVEISLFMLACLLGFQMAMNKFRIQPNLPKLSLNPMLPSVGESVRPQLS